MDELPTVPVNWTPWARLPADPAFSEAALAETLDGGQMFRWNREASGAWLGVWGKHAARLFMRGGALWESHPEADSAAPSALAHLLGLDQPYLRYEAELRGLCPEALRCSLDTHTGLRIVNLPLGEALLCFLCSPLKRIAQIKQTLDAVAAAYGPEIPCGLRALPDWQTLAGVPESGLRACRLGFRAKSIARTAVQLSVNPGFLDRVAALPYEKARRELTTLPGVGGKIADCALLYSGTCALEPFPVDTWMLRAMNRLHGTGLDSPEKAAALGRATYGRVAGLAQQHMFIAARKGLWE